MSWLVDQVAGEDRMRHLRDAPRIPGGRVDLDADEPIAELLAEPLEARSGHEAVAGEAQSEDLDAVVDPLLDDSKVVGRHAERPAGLGLTPRREAERE